MGTDEQVEVRRRDITSYLTENPTKATLDSPGIIAKGINGDLKTVINDCNFLKKEQLKLKDKYSPSALLAKNDKIYDRLIKLQEKASDIIKNKTTVPKVVIEAIDTEITIMKNQVNLISDGILPLIEELEQTEASNEE